MSDDSFGEELLTQELVTFDRVHVNVTQQLIVTTDDKLLLWLRELTDRRRRSNDWVLPASLLLAIVLTFSTTEFRNFVVSAETWQALFLIAAFLLSIWLASCLLRLQHRKDLSEEIEQLKRSSSVHKTPTVSL